MFRASSAHLQEDTVVHMRHMVLPPSTRVLGGLSVHSLSKNSFYDLWPCIVTDSLCIKPTDKPNSNFIGITNLHVSGSISAHHQEFLAVHRLWYILCSYDDRLLPGVGWNCKQDGTASSSILLLVANGHHNCIKCTKADVRLRNPDDGQKDCPKHVDS